MTLVDAILARNKPYANVIVGALIRRISPATAETLAVLIGRYAAALAPAMAQPAEALPYFCAVIAQESLFDPKAVNMNIPKLAGLANLWPPGIDPVQRINGLLARFIQVADNVGGTPRQQRDLELAKPPADRDARIVPMLRMDLGAAMFNGYYAPLPANVPSWREAVERFLFDPAWAIAKMASAYATNLDAAARLCRDGYVLDDRPTGPRVYPILDPKWIATAAYNAGWRGFKQGYADQTTAAWRAANTHIGRVRAHFEFFQTNLAEV